MINESVAIPYDRLGDGGSPNTKKST